MRTALRRATLLGYEYVVVEGRPEYFSRLGFVTATQFGLSRQSERHAPEFMVVELVPGALAGRAGVVHYQTPFPQTVDG